MQGTGEKKWGMGVGNGPGVRRQGTYLWLLEQRGMSRDNQESGDRKGVWQNHWGGMETWDRRRLDRVQGSRVGQESE